MGEGKTVSKGIMAIQIHRCEFEPASKPLITTATKLGGHPVLLAPITWPVCAQCGTPMQFLAQISLEKPVAFKIPFVMAYVFICPNEESCNTSDPRDGANAVILQTKSGRFSKPIPMQSPAAFLPEWACDISKTRHSLEEDGDVSKIAGEPDWIQDEKTPQCPGCEKAMSFVAQILAELPAHAPVINAMPPKMNAKEAIAAVDQAIRSSRGEKLAYSSIPSGSRNMLMINSTPVALVRVEDTFPVFLQVFQSAKQLGCDLVTNLTGGGKYVLPFGDAGMGYVFLCGSCQEGHGAFLWQG